MQFYHQHVLRVSLIILILIYVIINAKSLEKVVCYWGTWAAYRQGNGKFEVTDIDPTLCTHFVYTFLKATADGRVDYYDPYLDLSDNYGKGYIDKFIALRSRSPSTKFLMSIGGWTIGSAVFSQIASSPGARSTFARSVMGILDKHNFDGFDFDWEYPNQREGSQPSDKQNFNLLLQELKNVLSPRGKILSIATASVASSASKSYDVRRVCEIVDFVNLMTYDLHGSWDGKTGINAPMYCRSDDNPKWCVDEAVKFWLNNGCSAQKIIVGAPLYGRSFTLYNPNNNGINSPAGPGNAGTFVPEQGFLGYNEICYNIQRNGWIRKWEDTQKVPYAYKGNQWVGYDDTQSLEIKLSYVKNNNLGGIMFWSIETDDFKNICGKGKNPLLTLARNSMRTEHFEYAGMPLAYEFKPQLKSVVIEKLLIHYRSENVVKNYVKIFQELYEI